MAIDIHVCPGTRGKRDTRLEELIAALADRQYGVVARRQPLALAVGAGAIDDRIARGVLRPLYRGAFAMADEVTVERGIPGTTPARTLLDLASVLDFHQLERAVHETEYHRLTSPSPSTLLTRHHRRRGTKALRAIVDQGRLGATLARSDLEIDFLAFLDRQEIPRPLVNEPIGPYTVDGLWPDQRLVVELDSRRAHETTKAFEADRARDRALMTKGYRVVRITWRQLHADGPTIAAQLRQLLSPPTTPAASPRRP
jgi:hypothetical protein